MFSLLATIVCVTGFTPKLVPTPSWVKPAQVPSLEGPDTGDYLQLLDDRQSRFTEKSASHYQHTANLVLSTEGVDAVAHDVIEFEPAYEKVEVHGIWRTRNGLRKSVWHPEDIRVVDHESKADERIYDGSRQVLIDTRDIRVGDILETAWTVTGLNPVMNSQVSWSYSQASTRPIVSTSARVVWERRERPNFKTHGDFAPPVETQEKNTTVFEWPENESIPAREDLHLPADVNLNPWVELTSWKDWHQVAAWASTLFQSQLKTGPLFEQELRRFQALPKAEQALAATRFVQDDIRYLGLEIALSSHLPHSQEWVLERRFGDCKDKALLLVAFLRAFGYRAWPALVNSQWHGAVADWLPSSDSFDHAIVMAEIDGKRVFLDATQNLVRGALDDLGPPPFQKALLVDPATSQLTEIPQQNFNQPTLDIVQSWITEKTRAELTVTTIATKVDAVDWRHRVAEQSKETLAKSLRDDREALYQTQLTSLSVQVQDDQENNTVVVEERYQVEPFFDSSGQRQLMTEVSRYFPTVPAPGENAQLYAVAHPVNVRERIEVTAHDFATPSAPAARHLSMPAAKLDIVSETKDKTLTVSYHYQSLNDRVVPEAFASMKTGLKQMHDQANFVYHPQAIRGVRLEDSAVFRGSAAALVALTGATVLLVWLLSRRRLAVREAESLGATGRLHTFRRQSAHATAESAASAQRIDNVNLASKFFPKLCSHGHPLQGDIVQVDSLRLDERAIVVLGRTCATCHREVRRYFIVS